MSIRDEIRELCIAHDKQLAEDREWLAQKKPLARQPVQKSYAEAALAYRTVKDAIQPVPMAEPQPLPANEDDAAVDLFDDPDLNERFTDLMAHLIADLRAERRQESAKALAERDARINRLEGRVDALIAILGQERPSKSIPNGHSLLLPDGRRHNV